MSKERFRIVAIDDESDILELTRLTLASTYDVITVSDPSQAMQVLEMAEPDLAIIDIMMPRITGYQILEEMKKSSCCRGTLAMFLSAKDSEREIKYGYKLGANFYLTKPFPPERLLKSLEMLLQPLGAPRHKSFSLREIELRRKTKLDVAVHAVNAVSDVLSHAVASSRGHSLTPSPESVETPETPQSGFKLKRLLAKMDPEPDSEKWVG